MKLLPPSAHKRKPDSLPPASKALQVWMREDLPRMLPSDECIIWPGRNIDHRPTRVMPAAKVWCRRQKRYRRVRQVCWEAVNGRPFPSRKSARIPDCEHLCCNPAHLLCVIEEMDPTGDLRRIGTCTPEEYEEKYGHH